MTAMRYGEMRLEIDVRMYGDTRLFVPRFSSPEGSWGTMEDLMQWRAEIDRVLGVEAEDAKYRKPPVTSCLKCPHHRVEPDPSSGDSFDWMDDSIVCSIMKPPDDELRLRKLYENPPGRIVCGPDRCAEREYKRRGEPIPEWCPL